jgi:hypothetical protein
MVETPGLSCMSCHKEVVEEQGKFFAEVFVCPDCFLLATRFYERAEQDLKRLLVMMKEAIRVGLLQGKLQFKTPEQIKEAPRNDVLEKLSELAKEARKKRGLE